jgi:hypothetical protein
MIYSKELLNRLHRLSYANRPLVERSTICGCLSSTRKPTTASTYPTTPLLSLLLD